MITDLKPKELNKMGLDNDYCAMFLKHDENDPFNKDKIRCVLVEHGMKLFMDSETFEVIIKQEYIKENFKLNVRIDDEIGYSVYFKGIDYLNEDEEVGQIEYF